MTTTPLPDGDPEAAPALPITPESVRAGGIEGLGPLLGDLAHVLAEVAAEPGPLFSADAVDRAGSAALTHLLAVCHEIGTALHVLEARTAVAHEKHTRREVERTARDRAAHEDSAVPSPSARDTRATAIARRDLSLITRRSPAAAGRTLTSARRLVEEMPEVRTALAHHRISSEVATAITTATGTVSSAQRREVDAVLGERLPYLDGAGLRDWSDEVHAVVSELDPEGGTLRHRRARRCRSVTLTPAADGMARLSALLPAIDAHLVHKRLSLEAERRRAEGSEEGHGPLMADALVDTVLGREDAMDQVELDVGVIITDRALLRPDSGEPARIAGYGAVPPEAVRAQLRASLEAPAPGAEDPLGEDGPAVRAVLRRLYTHPTSGELVAVESRARAFPPALGRLLRWRDTSCRGPFCNAAARQHDHVQPHARGGPTSADNGQEACAHCNGKELDLAHVEVVEDPRTPGHRVAWTGHGGTTRVTGPRPLTRPQPVPEDSDPAGAIESADATAATATADAPTTAGPANDESVPATADTAEKSPRGQRSGGRERPFVVTRDGHGFVVRPWPHGAPPPRRPGSSGLRNAQRAHPAGPAERALVRLLAEHDASPPGTSPP